ncbi:MAG: hypothetical protein J1E64_15515 [Acetatifactor sp.]|nr:hypothetical protein [Acetatifactor sp.]
MEEKLQIVLKDYVKGVENVCNILIKSINCSENLNLKGKYDFMAYRSKIKKMEFEAGGISYRLHGKGCEAFNEKKYIDWEFGFRSRWCGIEPWKVSMTLKENKSSYIEYYDGDIVKSSCDLLVEEGIMFKKNDLYYFEIPKSETFKPEFPIEYDTLIVEHSNSKWLIPRNKVIDRFIRKSSWVYNQINRNEDNYILRFLFQGREIYTIPYNDIGYPENAVKIMSDNIINNLLKTK